MVGLNCLPERNEVALTGACVEVSNVDANGLSVLALLVGFLEAVLPLVLSRVFVVFSC